MAVWFAQITGSSISATNQWNSKPAGGGTVLNLDNIAYDDILCANGKSGLFIDRNITCSRISTATETGDGIGAAGGGFIIDSSRTITASIKAGGNTCVVAQSGVPITLNIVGNINGGTTTNAYGLYLLSQAIVNITGNITGGSIAAFTHGIYSTTTATITISGNITGGSYSNSRGIYLYTGHVGTLTVGTPEIPCTVCGGTAIGAHGINNIVASDIVINGNVIAGTLASGNGVLSTGAASITVNGNVSGAASGSGAGINASITNTAKTLIVNGNVIGGAGTLSPGIVLQTMMSGNVTVNGNVVGVGSSSTAGGYGISSSSIMPITITINNGDLVAGIWSSAVNNSSTALTILNGGCINNSLYSVAVTGAFQWNPTVNSTITFWTTNILPNTFRIGQRFPGMNGGFN